jgi:magnesium-transporting ATPase (P-type)
VLLESGDRIPADLRLLACNDLVVDESLLTGESTAVLKNASAIFKADTPIGDRCNMAFAGSLVSRGRGQKVDGKKQVFVKSAVEKLLPMCARMAAPGRDRDLDRRLLETQAEDLASRGYRVIALACGEPALATGSVFSETQLKGLNLLGMIDPLRGEAESAIASCRQAGIEVVMLTGHQPATALAIARKLELADSADQIVTGPQLKQAAAGGDMDQLTRQARVFALVEPRQKLDEARNGTLLRMVLFENIHVFNSRSETHSALRHNRLRNPVRLFGTVTAQLVHIGAMYTPWISDALCIQPVSPQHWLELLGLVLTVLVAMKFHKAYRRNLGKL